MSILPDYDPEAVLKRIREKGAATVATPATVPENRGFERATVTLRSATVDQNENETGESVACRSVSVAASNPQKSATVAGVAGVAGVIRPNFADPEGVTAHFQERAAIREYDGQRSRADAERLAYGELIAAWLLQHPPANGVHDLAIM